MDRKTYEDFKNDVAVENGYDDFGHMERGLHKADLSDMVSGRYKEAAIRYGAYMEQQGKE